MSYRSVMRNDYIKLEWRGCEDSEDGVAIFTFNDDRVVEIHLPNFTVAYDMYHMIGNLTMDAFHDGIDYIKRSVRAL